MCSKDGKDVKAELPAPLSKIENDWFLNWASGLHVFDFWLGIKNDPFSNGIIDLGVGYLVNQHGSPHTWSNWQSNEPNWHSETLLNDPSNVFDPSCVWSSGDVEGDPFYGWADDLCTSGRNVLCTHVLCKAYFLIKIFI